MERDQPQGPDPELKKDRSREGNEPDGAGPGSAHPLPEQDQFDSLGATRVSGSLGGDSADALAERTPNPAAAPRGGGSSGPSSRKSRNILGGDFLLLRKLGQGAMAVVYKARQLSFDRNVA